MKAETKGRIYAVFGFVWITGIVGYLILATDWPVLLKVAFGEYGAIGLIDMAGIWRGRHKDATWNRRMRRVQLAGFLLAVALSLIWLISN